MKEAFVSMGCGSMQLWRWMEKRGRNDLNHNCYFSLTVLADFFFTQVQHWFFVDDDDVSICGFEFKLHNLHKNMRLGESGVQALGTGWLLVLTFERGC